MPRYVKPSGDHSKGKEGSKLGTEFRLPSGIASDFVKLILYPENLLNESMTLSNTGIEVSGLAI